MSGTEGKNMDAILKRIDRCILWSNCVCIRTILHVSWLTRINNFLSLSTCNLYLNNYFSLCFFLFLFLFLSICFEIDEMGDYDNVRTCFDYLFKYCVLSLSLVKEVFFLTFPYFSLFTFEFSSFKYKIYSELWIICSYH